MAKPVHRSTVRRPPFPSDLRRLFRNLARVAVASTFSVAAAGCTRYDLGESPIPDPDIINNMAGNGGQGGAGGAAGTAGSSGGFGGAAGVSGVGGFGGDAGSSGTSGTGGFGGAGGTPPPNPTGTWQNIACRASDGGPELIDSTRLLQSIDFAALYSVRWTSGGGWVDTDGGIAEPEAYVVEQILFGSACTTAADFATCLRSLNSLKPTVEACNEGEACRVLLTTDGDALTRIEERAALIALLGPIDTIKDAALAAWLGGTDVACSVGTGPEVPLGTRVRTVEGGFEVQTRIDDCVDAFTRNELVHPDGSVSFISEVSDSPTCAVGRRPEGLLAAVPYAACGELGAYFASAAHLEAASVHAFARLACELEALGAPEAFVVDARRAALEEVVHTRMVGSIAERFGSELVAPQVAAPVPRDAFAIAVENAIEGCVRETYGALVAWYQAENALDPVVRQAMARIAEDETRHAELAWKVATWLEPQLSELEQLQINAARSAAFSALRGELGAAGLSSSASAVIGLPNESHGIALLDQLGAALSLQA